MSLKVTYRIVFRDGGEVSFNIETTSINAGFETAMYRGSQLRYQGRVRELQMVAVTKVEEVQS